MDIGSKVPDLLSRLMSATALRRDVLANNIASQNLPGYRRRDVNFEAILAEQLSQGARPEDLDHLSPEIEVDFNTPTRADGNNVSAEEEASLLRENRIRFELYAMLKKGSASLITQALTSSR